MTGSSSDEEILSMMDDDDNDDHIIDLSSMDEDNSFGSSDDENACAAAPVVSKSKRSTAPKAKSNSTKPPNKKQTLPQDVLSPSNAQPTTTTKISNSTKKQSGKKKTVEEKYQKKSPLEHILLRPDTYIGSIEPTRAPMYVLDPLVPHTIRQQEITFTPGLYKIFDEIVVNAADNKQRDANMDRLEITVDPERNRITVKNNGEGIPVQFHQKEQMYVPTLIFGHLLTGSNFDDHEKKTTGGRNGYVRSSFFGFRTL